LSYAPGGNSEIIVPGDGLIPISGAAYERGLDQRSLPRGESTGDAFDGEPEQQRLCCPTHCNESSQ